MLMGCMRALVIQIDVTADAVVGLANMYNNCIMLELNIGPCGNGETAPSLWTSQAPSAVVRTVDAARAPR